MPAHKPTPISPWHPFPLVHASSPPLYIQRHFTLTSYTVYVTDLTHIWGESLTKSAICDRAEDRSCAIDPSSDDSQLQILLQKLASGITGLNPVVNVQLEFQTRSSGTTVIIDTKEKLQDPLGTLEWRFRLKSLGEEEFTRLFSLPLLYVGSLLSRQTASLLQVVDEKDATIAKLLDKLEECRIPVESVFSGWKKGRPPTGKAKGIVKFEKREWWKGVLEEVKEVKESNDLMKGVFKGWKDAQKSAPDDEEVTKSEVLLPDAPEEGWYTKVSGKHTVKGEEEIEEPKFTPRKPVRRKETGSDDDDFEAMPMSSPVRARFEEARRRNTGLQEEEKKNVPKVSVNDETTEDEDDLDPAPKPTSQGSKTSGGKPSPSPSGRAGSTSKSPAPGKAKREETDSARIERNFDNQLAVYDTFASIDDSTTDDEAPAPPPQPSPAKKSGIKKTIGGGKKKAAAPAETTPMVIDETDSEEEATKRRKQKEPTPDPEPVKPKSKIKGTIGRKPTSDAAKRKEPEPDSDEEMAEPEQEAPSKPPPRKKKERTVTPPIVGMDEEAAQKRRDELQKKLAAQASKKKGRKF